MSGKRINRGGDMPPRHDKSRRTQGDAKMDAPFDIEEDEEEREREADPQRRPTAAQAVRRREHRQTARRRSRRAKTVLCIILVLLALAAGAFAWWRGFAKKPVIDTTPPPVQDTRDPNAPMRLSGDRKEDFYTFLIIGRDTVGGGNTDTILVAAYDVKSQKLAAMNIPRDTMVNVSWDVKKINSIYNQYKDKDKAIAHLDQEVAALVGFVPDFQVVIELNGVKNLVDAVGGVEFEVPCDMNKLTEDIVIDLNAGMQHIDGNKAMQLIRYRGYPNADLGRVQTQQAFLKVVMQKCLSVSIIPRIGELSKVFQDNVKTNLTAGEIAWFAEKAVVGGLRAENVNFFTMPCDTGIKVWSRGEQHKLDYVVPRVDELVAMVNENLNPYIKALEKHELDIMYVNENGSIGSSTGTLEDTEANKR